MLKVEKQSDKMQFKTKNAFKRLRVYMFIDCPKQESCILLSVGKNKRNIMYCYLRVQIHFFPILFAREKSYALQ